jgi:hypothetical protein
MITNFELDAMEEKTMAYFKVQARDLHHHEDRRQKQSISGMVFERRPYRTDAACGTVQLTLFCTTHVHITSSYPLLTSPFCIKTYIRLQHLHVVTSNLLLSITAVKGDLLNQLQWQSAMSRIHNVLSVAIKSKP